MMLKLPRGTVWGGGGGGGEREREREREGGGVEGTRDIGIGRKGD